MMNGLSVQNYDSPYPAGWNGTDCKPSLSKREVKMLK